jgi:integrase
LQTRTQTIYLRKHTNSRSLPQIRRRHNHDLRHSYATGALKAGVSPKVVSDRIGHANVGFFLQTYAHVLKNDDREAAEQAAAFLLGSAWDGDSQDR